MARRHAIIDEENLRIPQDALSFQGFQGWAESEEFPETGRIDYLAGDVEVDMSPEDLHTHGIVKGAIYAACTLWLRDGWGRSLSIRLASPRGSSSSPSNLTSSSCSGNP